MIARQQSGINAAAPGIAPSRRAADSGSPAPPSRAAWTRLAACASAAARLQLDGTLITIAPLVTVGLGRDAGADRVLRRWRRGECSVWRI